MREAHNNAALAALVSGGPRDAGCGFRCYLTFCGGHGGVGTPGVTCGTVGCPGQALVGDAPGVSVAVRRGTGPGVSSSGVGVAEHGFGGFS